MISQPYNVNFLFRDGIRYILALTILNNFLIMLVFLLYIFHHVFLSIAASSTYPYPQTDLHMKKWFLVKLKCGEVH